VPAPAQLWSVEPFGGEVRDGCLWGRGAVDMKDMDAMILAVARRRLAEGRPPARDVVLAFFADEEAGGQQGSFWLAEHRRELFADCTEAVSEVGGFSVTLGEEDRAYFIETARKGVAWVRATARGNAAHASLTNTENAVTRLCAAIARVGQHRWPAQLSGTSAQLVEALSDLLGIDVDPETLDLSGTPLAPVAGLITSSLRHTTNPTMFHAGQAFNVVPGEASAFIDGRFVPGFAEEFVSCIRELLGPQVQMELADLTSGGESPYGAGIVEAMGQALRAEDPGARTVPYCAAASTDNAAFHDAGIQGYGFAPLKLPPDFDFAAMYHGVDERVPTESVQFGARVLDRFLDLC
jgi:acetylornithine deacetylase/succinyl-diaminopimelate desuccinylase-like protein